VLTPPRSVPYDASWFVESTIGVVATIFWEQPLNRLMAMSQGQFKHGVQQGSTRVEDRNISNNKLGNNPWIAFLVFKKKKLIKN
jgi:hypothetical protein